MSEVLYRKYRSQTFDELIGQAHITDILKNAVKSGQTSHAYLFVGSRGTGKTSTARILAKALNCRNIQDDGNPCNECEACRSIGSGTFLDMIEIDAASNRGIDQIRELKERIEFAPSEGKYKVYIIDEVHMLTTEAFNALLKTLEEPPPHVIFILATTDVHKLPATILSRCQRYDFRLGTEKEIESVLKRAIGNEKVSLTDDALKVLVQNAQGSYRDALSLLDVVVSGQLDSDKPEEVSENEVRTILGIPDSTMVYYLLEKLAYGEFNAALELVNELDSRGVNLQQFVKFILLSLREILVIKVSGSSSEEYTFAEKLDTRKVIQLINLFLDADRKLRTAPLPGLVLEMLIAEVSLDHSSGNSAGGTVRATTPKSPPASSMAVSDKKTDVGSTTAKDSTKVSKVKGGASTEAASKVTKKETPAPAKATEAPKPAKNSSTKKSDSADQESSNEDNLASVTLEEVTEKWDDVVREVQQFNGHMYAFLKVAKIDRVEEGKLHLQVPFEFHKERIESPRSREALNGVFTNVYGGTLHVQCEVDSTIQRRKKTTAEVVLKNIQQSAQSVKSEPPAAKPAPAKAQPPRENKVSKKVEEIFADV